MRPLKTIAWEAKEKNMMKKEQDLQMCLGLLVILMHANFKQVSPAHFGSTSILLVMRNTDNKGH